MLVRIADCVRVLPPPVSIADEPKREVGEDDRTDAPFQSNEALYRRIVETAAEGIWTIDAEAKTSFVNPKLTQMLGYTAEEMQGRSLLDFIDDEWRPMAEENLARRKDGIAEEHEFKFRCKDGSALWTSMAATPIHDEAGVYVGA